jgi:hypothetical protein
MKILYQFQKLRERGSEPTVGDSEVITRLAMVPASVQELNVVYELVEDHPGLAMGARNF